MKSFAAKLSLTKQSGAALVIGLIFILIMTIIGVAAMQNTTFQERMAGGFQDRELAFQAAETSLRAGEIWLRDEDNATIAEEDHTVRILQPQGWDGSSPVTDPDAVISVAVEGVNVDPVFYVSEPHLVRIDPADPSAGVCSVYPVVSRARGQRGANDDDATIVILQSYYETPCYR